MLASCDGKEPTKLVAALAHAKLETNATTMGRSLKSAKGVLESLRTTRWDLFSAVSAIQGDRAEAAEKLIEDVVTWLKTDEHALAGGLASKLSDAEGRAIKLLTPPKPPKPDAVKPDPKPDRQAMVGARIGVGTIATDLGGVVDDLGGTVTEAGEQSPPSAHDRLDDRGGAAMSVGALSPQQLRTIVEEKWQRDDEAIAVGLHVAALLARTRRGGVRVRQGPGRPGRHGLPDP